MDSKRTKMYLSIFKKYIILDKMRSKGNCQKGPLNFNAILVSTLNPNLLSRLPNLTYVKKGKTFKLIYLL